VALLGRSYHGSPEADDTLTKISHGVEISIAGGGADEKDVEIGGVFILSYFILFLLFLMICSLISR